MYIITLFLINVHAPAFMEYKCFIITELMKSCLLQIGDFGMARDLMDDTYYKSSGGKIPVKWTSPEVRRRRREGEREREREREREGGGGGGGGGGVYPNSKMSVAMKGSHTLMMTCTLIDSTVYANTFEPKTRPAV